MQLTDRIQAKAVRSRVRREQVEAGKRKALERAEALERRRQSELIQQKRSAELDAANKVHAEAERIRATLSAAIRQATDRTRLEIETLLVRNHEIALRVHRKRRPYALDVVPGRPPEAAVAEIERMSAVIAGRELVEILNAPWTIESLDDVQYQALERACTLLWERLDNLRR